MKLAILEVVGLLAAIISPLFTVRRPKKKINIEKQELSDYAVNHDGFLVPLEYEQTDW